MVNTGGPSRPPCVLDFPKRHPENVYKVGHCPNLVRVARYRVTLVVEYLGWVDNDFSHSSVCLVLLGQMRIWQNRLVNRVRWWIIKYQSQPNQGMQPPVTL